MVKTNIPAKLLVVKSDNSLKANQVLYVYTIVKDVIAIMAE